jgi:hypothetical protein
MKWLEIETGPNGNFFVVSLHREQCTKSSGAEPEIYDSYNLKKGDYK